MMMLALIPPIAILADTSDIALLTSRCCGYGGRGQLGCMDG